MLPELGVSTQSRPKRGASVSETKGFPAQESRQVCGCRSFVLVEVAAGTKVRPACQKINWGGGPDNLPAG